MKESSSLSSSNSLPAATPPLADLMRRLGDHDLPPPELVLEDDGELAIDWNLASDCTVSISVRADGTAGYAALTDAGSTHGRFVIADAWPAALLRALNEVNVKADALRAVPAVPKEQSIYESRSPDGDGPIAKAGDVKTEAGLQPPESGADDCTDPRRETTRAGSEPADSHQPTKPLSPQTRG